MLHERAAGFILYRMRGGVREYLIVQNKNGGHWGFPKGRIELGETPEQAARREVAEEVGIGKVSMTSFRDRLTYQFVRQGELVKKEVLVFLAETAEEGSLSLGEIQDMRWLPYSEALHQLTHNEQRELLSRAEAFLSTGC